MDGLLLEGVVDGAVRSDDPLFGRQSSTAKTACPAGANAAIAYLQNYASI